MIDTQKGLHVPSNSTLALLGGNVALEGATLKTAGGRIEIGSVVFPAVVILNPVADGWSFGYAGVQTFGNIQLSQRSTVDASGLGGGDIQVQGRQIALTGGSQIEASTLGNQPGGALEVTGSESVELNSLGTNLLTGLITDVYSGATGTAGNLRVTTEQLNADGNVQISNSTYSQGNAENLIINARTLNFQNGAQILSATYGNGEAGNILIDANRIQMTGGQIYASTFSPGNGGDLVIRAADAINLTGSGTGFFTQVEPGATGLGGNLLVETGRLSVADGAQISNSTSGAGNSGSLTVRASDSVNLNSSGTSDSITGLRAEANSQATGNGGNLRVETSSLNLEGENSRINASTYGSSKAGNITIDTARMQIIEGGQIFASTFSVGDAGNITIRASDFINLDGSGTDDFLTGLFAQVEQNATGSGGNLLLETGNLNLVNGGQVSTSTSGAGDAGDLTVRASESINLNGLGTSPFRTSLLTETREGETGFGGDLLIETRNLNVINGGQISSSAFGAGGAGDLTIRASESINLRGSGTGDGTGLVTQADPGAIGAGGDLTIRARNVVVRNGANINADTFGNGDAGNLTIRARNVIVRESQVSTSTNGEGDAGDMIIQASNLVELNGELPDARDGVGSPGGLLAQVNDIAATGRGGNLTIDTRRLRVSDGSKVQVATFGQGNAGVLRIQADEIDVFDTARPNLYSTGILAGVGDDPINNRETEASGSGGRLFIDANRLSIRGGEVSTDTRGLGNAGIARIRARDLIEVIDPVAASGRRSFLSAGVTEGGRGNAGNLIIDTGRLVVRGGQVTVSSSGRAQAGNLIIRATDSVDLSGVSPRRVRISAADGRTVLPEQASSLSAQVDRTGTRPGGNLTIQTNRLRVSDRAQITVSNEGLAQAGDLSIDANSVELSDRARISAETRSDNGGNIAVTADSVRLRDDSDIQTNVARGSGNGGDIDITADSVLAFDDSDIITEAPNQGGDIRLNSPVFFGEDYQPDASTEDNSDGNNRVDLDATGSVSSGAVQTPDTSFIQNSLSDLPTNAIDTETLLANSCIARTENGGTFLITGSGGLPPNRPGSAAPSTYPTDTVRAESNEAGWQPGDPMIEPQGVYRLPNGELVLSHECN